MKNIITGWGTTLIGIIIIALAICDYFGVCSFPAPDGIGEDTQVKTAFIVGFILFLVPQSKIEKWLTNLLKNKTDA